ncbi:MAG: peptide ABC transporter substrate-binding protein, partial [Candidatus Latescibacteria bacterium]|nr:peptide ABC transporter substrate-binding protein [Candidatus Latescibacterota bacterium]
ARLPSDAAPVQSQVFRYLAAEPKSMDMNTRLYGAGGSEFLFERLCMFGLDGELLPGAAASWESSEDSKTWTFHLRPEARWSDGRPVTAFDFEYTYRRFLHPDAGNVYAFLYYDIKGAKAYNQRELSDVDQLGVRAVDDYTFVIETEQPCAFLPYITAYHTSSPAPRWQVEKYENRWTDAGNCVSNSAFQLESWISGQYLTFGLNPFYEGPNPGYLRQIVRVFTGQVGAVSSTNDLGLLPYENNEIDVIEISPMMLDQVSRDPVMRDEVWRYDQFSTIYLFFKTQEAPFDDKRVRQAIGHAIDKEALVRTILKGMMIPAYTMLPHHFPGNVGDKYNQHQAFNRGRARSLLAEAGYPDGKGFPVKELWLADASAGSAISQASQAIQEMLKENLNIDIKIRNTEGGAYRTSMYNWEMPMSVISFGYDFPDPHSMLGIIWRSQPKGYTRHDWQNARFDRLIDSAAGEMNPVRRMAMYDEAEGILASEVGAVFLWHVVTSQLRKPWVKGIPTDKWGNSPNYRNGHAYYDIYIGEETVGTNRPEIY